MTQKLSAREEKYRQLVSSPGDDPLAKRNRIHIYTSQSSSTPYQQRTRLRRFTDFILYFFFGHRDRIRPFEERQWD
jgi:hypothetical protein